MNTIQTKAIWTPGWYEMDQTVAVGMEQKFWFFKDKSRAGIIDEAIDLVFFNQLDSTCNCQVRFAHVVDIWHDILGPLARVDTDGLDYLFVTTAGREIMVNAEEQPGKSDDPVFDIDDWSVWVTLNNVSEPISEIEK